jgi:glycosyltransferase involved in cell wall biosynthesis
MNIAISEAILKDCFKNKLKVEKIYNGADTKKWKQHVGSADEFRIISVGRIGYEGVITYQLKGYDILIKALKECKDKGMKFSCNIVGGDIDYVNNSSIKYLKKLNDDLGLSEEIKFLGNREDIPELLAPSDLFILPSRFEGLPIVLLEAMAARLPVIASNISGSNELIKDEKNGLLFESENYLELAKKIFYLYNHREEMERMEQNAYEYVQSFDISIMCEKYWDLYKRLIQ